MKILIPSLTNYIILIHSNYKHSTEHIYYYRVETHTTFIITTHPTLNLRFVIQISGLTTIIPQVTQYAFMVQPRQMTILIPSPTNYIIYVHSNYKHFAYYYRAELQITFTTITRPTVNPGYSIQIFELTSTNEHMHIKQATSEHTHHRLNNTTTLPPPLQISIPSKP